MSDDEPINGLCDLCTARVAVIPGPQRRKPRSHWVIPSGYLVGYIVELANRSFLICRDCLDVAMKAAA